MSIKYTDSALGVVRIGGISKAWEGLCIPDLNTPGPLFPHQLIFHSRGTFPTSLRKSFWHSLAYLHAFSHALPFLKTSLPPLFRWSAPPVCKGAVRLCLTHHTESGPCPSHLGQTFIMAFVSYILHKHGVSLAPHPSIR